MKTDRHRIEISVIPDSVFHGAEADRLSAMLQGDEVIRARVLALAEKARRGKPAGDFAGVGIA